MKIIIYLDNQNSDPIKISSDFPCYLKFMIHKLYGGLKIKN